MITLWLKVIISYLIIMGAGMYIQWRIDLKRQNKREIERRELQERYGREVRTL